MEQQKVLTGRVIEERGRGLADVAVSNGEAVVLTDRAGRYELAVDPLRHTHVFVTVPPGWAAADTCHHPLEQWCGGLRTFMLRRRGRVRRSIRFAAVTDLHYDRTRDGAVATRRLRRALSEVVDRAEDAEFIIAAGDLSDRGFRSDLEQVARLLREPDRPVFPVFGAGHDALEERKIVKTDKPWCRHYLEFIGPIWYSFEWGRFHFSIWANEDHHFTEPMLSAKGRWLTRDLKLAAQRGLERIVVVHCPPNGRLLRKLSRLGVRLVLGGHFHSFRTYCFRSTRVVNFPPLTMGGIDMMPRGFLACSAAASGPVKFVYHALGPAFTTTSSPIGRGLTWKRKVSGYFHRTPPVLDEQGRLYIACGDDLRGAGGHIRCLDARTGRRVWSTPIDDAVKNAVVISGDRVLANTQTGVLVCLNRGDGRPLWTRRLHGHPDRWLHTSPVVARGTVVAGHSGGGIQAFSLNGGRQLWSIEGHATTIVSNRGDLWPNYATPVSWRDCVVIPVLRKSVRCLDVRSGAVRWQFDHDYTYNLPGILRWRGSVWIPSPRPGGILQCLDLLTGRRLHHAPANGVTVAWSAGAGRMFLVVYDTAGRGQGRLQCRDASSGQMLWQKALGGDLAHAYPYNAAQGPAVQAAPVPAGNAVLVAGTDGKASLFDGRSGRCLRRMDLGSPVFACPVVAGSRFWSAQWSGDLVCRHLRTVCKTDNVSI